MEKVTVLMPVGPSYNFDWLHEAFDSAVNQTYTVDEILIIDDGANLSDTTNFAYPFAPGEHLTGKPYRGIGQWYNKEKGINYRIWKSPANVGFTAAFNLGMGLAANELVVYLAADDKLEPTAIERAVQTYLDNDKKDAWYSYTYESSSGDVCSIPINAAMIPKHFWAAFNGFPPCAFVGPDALILSCLLAHAPDRIIHIDEGVSLYWIREHPDQETKTHTWKFVPEMNSIRNKYTKEFKFNE